MEKNSKVGGISLQNFGIYYAAIKTVWPWLTGKHTHQTPQRTKKQTHAKEKKKKNVQLSFKRSIIAES